VGASTVPRVYPYAQLSPTSQATDASIPSRIEEEIARVRV
jgi:hypothetical protein